MFRKILMTLTVLFMLPVFAHAWTVNSKTATTGQGNISPAGNQSYATGVNSQEYTVTPAPGYTVKRVTLDGAIISATDGKYVVPYVPGLAYRYLVAYFAAPTVSITTQISPVGTGAIREDTWESLTNIPAGSNRQILVLPNAGYAVASITADGAVITDNGDGSKTVVYNNLQSNRIIIASFSLTPVVTVSAGNDITINGPGAEFTGTLFGGATSNQGTINYAWSGAGLSFGSPSAALTTVYGAVPGIYVATLRVTSGQQVRTDTAQVAVLERTAYLAGLCTGCHSGNSPKVVADYDLSIHKTKQVSCQECHTETPHNDVKALCVNCHTAGNSKGLPWPPTGLSFHTAYSGTDLCSNCHETHNPAVILLGAAPYPHYNNYSTAQYVTTHISCDNCHSSLSDSSFHVYPANMEWARSGKGNPASASYTAFDFKTRGTTAPATPANTTSDDCVRCHTSTGYINFLTSGYTNIDAWGTSGLAVDGDRTREMVACNACHNTPFDTEFSTRGFERDPYDPEYVLSWGPTPRPSGYYNYSSAQTKKIKIKRDIPQSIGKSNLCVVCHIGNGAGVTLKGVVAVIGQGTGAFWQNVNFIDPHGMGSAGIMYRLTGYTYRSASGGVNPYDNPPSYNHSGLGDGETGNCVSCHMSAPEKHSYSAVTKNDGAITAITSAGCRNCHAGGLHAIPDGASLELFRAGYQASLQAVAQLLGAKGIHFDSAVYPYFFTTPDPAQHGYANRIVNWDAAAPVFKGADVMGAAFNLRLLDGDAGSYVHNSFYTKRLLYDTIDFLDNGSQDNTVAVTLQNMPVSQSFTQAMKEKVQGYISVRP